MSGGFLQIEPSSGEIRAAVLRALSPRHWRRADEVAVATRLPLRRVRRCLHELAAEMLVVGCVDSESPCRLTHSGLLEREAGHA